MKIECGEDAYRIVDGDNEGELSEYGDMALLESESGATHVAFMDSAEEPGEGFAATVYRLEPVSTEIEEVEFDESDDDDSESTGTSESDED